MRAHRPTAPPMRPVRAAAPIRVLDGFGRAVLGACRTVAPTTIEELEDVVATARDQSVPLTFRGAGRSYGDAAIGQRGLVVDTTGLDRITAWDPALGVIECEPGVTIEQLWRRTLADGYWPYVVPGTMRPTLAGCLAANVHGKNQFKVGTIGEHIEEFDLLPPSGTRLRCSRRENADVFHAAIGGFGMFGAVTRIKLRLHKVPGGRLQVRATAAPSLDDLLDQFEAALPSSDYAVGWIDGTAAGARLGRGELHTAVYAGADLDPDGAAWLDPARQDLPPHILGVPRSVVWRFLRLGTNRLGTAFVNRAKVLAARRAHGKTYLQSHVAFAFLLDYVPNWRLAYGPRGFLQVQLFVPYAGGRRTLRELLAIGPMAGQPLYLAVLKRHRPDPFLLTHGLDGWSLALDVPVPSGGVPELRRMTDRLTAATLAAGGRFYFAKDALLSPTDVAAAWGPERLAQFAALRRRVDPDRLLTSDLADRVGLP
jgi:decaprenylphospho-beta-D-ribofuranose 2-oxidase